MPRKHTRRRRLGAAGAALGCALLLAGCASMPDSSDVSKVGDEPRSEADSQVRVFGVQPQKNEQPLQIVRGFLEATTSDEADYMTARKYLTGDAWRWDPFTGITVLSGGPQLYAVAHHGVQREDAGTTIDMVGERTALVDRKHSYSPASSSYRGSFHLVKVDGEWRIDSLPDGLVLSDSDFQRIFHSVNMYYFARLGPEADQVPLAEDVLVADPVYVRRRIDPLTASVEALLAGPSTWLQPVVTTAFPARTRLMGQKLGLNDSGVLRVPLSDGATNVGRAQCERMAAQLLHTVQDQASAQVTSVDVERADGHSLCTLGHAQAQVYAPSRLTGMGNEQYYVDNQHRMVALSDNGETAQHVPGPFGGAPARLRSVAVSRDEQTAAGVTTDGRTLLVAPLSADGAQKQALTLGSTGPTGSTGELTAPSWDGLGNLWVADRGPQRQRLLLWREGHTTNVTLPDLVGGQIEAIRVAADGVRIAMLVSTGGRMTLQLGRIEWSGTAAQPRVSVTGLRTVTPQLTDVEAASWAGQSRLIVVGKQSRGVQQLQYVGTDGSAAYTPTLPGISGVSAVAAFEGQKRPLLVASKEGMFRLPTDADWQRVMPDGRAPVYPG